MDRARAASTAVTSTASATSWFPASANLYFRYPELNARRHAAARHRRAPEVSSGKPACDQEAALAEKTPYVLPKRFHATMTVTADPNAAPARRDHPRLAADPPPLPFPGRFQADLTSSPPKHLDDERQPIRSVYLEQPAEKDQADPCSRSIMNTPPTASGLISSRRRRPAMRPE